jgi:GNAT superfamily N-acetyltransferase
MMRLHNPLVTIREYSASEELQVVELVHELQTHERPRNKWSKPPAVMAPWYIAEIERWCAKHDGSILVVEEDSRLLGYACLLGRCEKDRIDGDTAYAYARIADLVSTKAADGRGIGRALIAACEKIVRDKERVVLRVGTLTGNEGARKVYENLGLMPHHTTLDKLLK